MARAAESSASCGNNGSWSSSSRRRERRSASSRIERRKNKQPVGVGSCCKRGRMSDRVGIESNEERTMTALRASAQEGETMRQEGNEAKVSKFPEEKFSYGEAGTTSCRLEARSTERRTICSLTLGGTDCNAQPTPTRVARGSRKTHFKVEASCPSTPRCNADLTRTPSVVATARVPPPSSPPERREGKCGRTSS